MRIKKYENWKLTSSYHPNTPSNKTQKMSDIFSISQLLQTPKKSYLHEDERQYIFTDPKAINHTLNLNRQNFTKTDIQINFFNRPANRAQRQQTIKNRIKQRIKEQFSPLNFIEPITCFLNQDTTSKFPLTILQHRKTQPRQGRVYIKGNSVSLSSVDQKRRSKSTFLRASLSNFCQKSKIVQIDKFIQTEKEKQLLKSKFTPVEMKRVFSSSVAMRQRRKILLNKLNHGKLTKDLMSFNYDNQNYTKFKTHQTQRIGRQQREYKN